MSKRDEQPVRNGPQGPDGPNDACGNDQPHERHEFLIGAKRKDCPGLSAVYQADDRNGVVVGFKDEFAFLSNFWVEAFVLRDRLVWSGEHAFQAAKLTPGEEQEPVRRAILGACRNGQPSPSHAKRLGRRAQLRDGWEQKKVGIMRAVLEAKFGVSSPLTVRLLATEQRHLIEANTWGDEFWGVTWHEVNGGGHWYGQNQLGLLLMERRDVLRLVQKATVLEGS